MLSKLLTLLSTAQPRDDNGGGAWRNFLPLLIFAALAILNSVLKSKQKRSPPPRRTPQLPRTAPRPAQQVEPAPRLRQIQPRPTHKQPVAPTRPAPHTAILTASSPRHARSRPKPRPTARTQVSAAAPRPATLTQSKPRRQVQSTAQAAARRRAASQQQAIPQAPTPAQRLQTLLDQPDELVRAVLYSEIIGKPLALRTPQSFTI